VNAEALDIRNQERKLVSWTKPKSCLLCFTQFYEKLGKDFKYEGARRARFRKTERNCVIKKIFRHEFRRVAICDSTLEAITASPE